MKRDFFKPTYYLMPLYLILSLLAISAMLFFFQHSSSTEQIAHRNIECTFQEIVQLNNRDVGVKLNCVTPNGVVERYARGYVFFVNQNSRFNCNMTYSGSIDGCEVIQ